MSSLESVNISLQIEQRVNLNFLVKLVKTIKEILGDECLSWTQVSESFKEFKEKQKTTEDHACPWRTWASQMDTNIQTITTLICGKHRLSIRVLAELRENDKDNVRQILHEKFNLILSWISFRRRIARRIALAFLLWCLEKHVLDYSLFSQIVAPCKYY